MMANMNNMTHSPPASDHENTVLQPDEAGMLTTAYVLDPRTASFPPCLDCLVHVLRPSPRLAAYHRLSANMQIPMQKPPPLPSTPKHPPTSRLRRRTSLGHMFALPASAHLPVWSI